MPDPNKENLTSFETSKRATKNLFDMIDKVVEFSDDPEENYSSFPAGRKIIIEATVSNTEFTQMLFAMMYRPSCMNALGITMNTISWNSKVFSKDTLKRYLSDMIDRDFTDEEVLDQVEKDFDNNISN